MSPFSGQYCLQRALLGARLEGGVRPGYPLLQETPAVGSGGVVGHWPQPLNWDILSRSSLYQIKLQTFLFSC